MIQIPITREELEVKRAAAAANGIVLAGDSGEVEVNDPVFAGKTIGLKFQYDGALLSIVVTHHSWVEPVSKIEAKIQELLSA